jgi:hypothetical protein
MHLVYGPWTFLWGHKKKTLSRVTGGGSAAKPFFFFWN